MSDVERPNCLWCDKTAQYVENNTQMRNKPFCEEHADTIHDVELEEKESLLFLGSDWVWDRAR